MQNSNNKLEGQIKDLKATVNEYETANQQLDTKLMWAEKTYEEGLNKMMSEYERKEQIIHRQNQELLEKTQNERMDREAKIKSEMKDKISEIQKGIEASNQQITKLRDEKQSLLEENMKLTQIITEMGDEKDREIQNAVKKAKLECDRSRSRSYGRDNSSNTMSKYLESNYEYELAAQIKENEKLISKNDKLERHLDSLKVQIGELKNELLDLKARKKDKMGRVKDEAEKYREYFRNQIDALRDEMIKKKTNMDKMRNILEDYKLKVTHLERELSDVNEKWEKISKEERRKEKAYIKEIEQKLVSLNKQNRRKQEQKILWFTFFLAFAAKVPMIPVHLWLPEAHVEAPTAGSVILAGVLLKLGTYGLIRFSLPLFPQASFFFTPFVYTIALIGIVYTSFTAIRQTDFKRIIAYTSVAHMNVVILGIFSFNNIGIEGAILQSLSHGFVASALFVIIGVVYERYRTRLVKYYGGLVHTMPLYVSIFLFFTMANIGFPGTSGFIGEFLILVGSFKVNSTVTFFGATGMILGGCYSLWLLNRISFGNLKSQYLKKTLDINKREFFIFIPLISYTLILGLVPNTCLNSIHMSVNNLVENMYF